MIDPSKNRYRLTGRSQKPPSTACDLAASFCFVVFAFLVEFKRTVNMSRFLVFFLLLASVAGAYLKGYTGKGTQKVCHQVLPLLTAKGREHLMNYEVSTNGSFVSLSDAEHVAYYNCNTRFLSSHSSLVEINYLLSSCGPLLRMISKTSWKVGEQ